MEHINVPAVWEWLLSNMCIEETHILSTADGFSMVRKSLSDILAEKNIHDFLDSRDERLKCSRFFDDWFLYAVSGENGHTCSLLKLREQEHDAQDGEPADGDTPGVTISFIAFDDSMLLQCLANPTDENRKKLNAEINRVVAWRGQSHHRALKRYFMNPQSQGAYLVAETYTKHIASFAENGCLAVPDHYQEIVQQYTSHKKSPKFARLPRFIAQLNQKAGRVICDNEKIHIRDAATPDRFECAAILATHTGNTSVYSFAAEVEYHARFLIPAARMKIPLTGKSIYESAIRADMSVGDAEFQGPAPFYKEGSKIFRRQYELHREQKDISKEGALL